GSVLLSGGGGLRELSDVAGGLAQDATIRRSARFSASASERSSRSTWEIDSATAVILQSSTRIVSSDPASSPISSLRRSATFVLQVAQGDDRAAAVTRARERPSPVPRR